MNSIGRHHCRPKRLAEHLSAFPNLPDGGFLVFGITDTGKVIGIRNPDVQNILGQLENLARSALEPVMRLDHRLEDWEGVKILIVYISESETKPVVLRGKALDHTFIRSDGSTRKASRQEVGSLMLNSRTPRWEDLNASPLLSSKDLIERLDCKAQGPLCDSSASSYCFQYYA